MILCTSGQIVVYDRNKKNWFRPNTEYSAISTEYSAEYSAEYLPYCQSKPPSKPPLFTNFEKDSKWPNLAHNETVFYFKT